MQVKPDTLPSSLLSAHSLESPPFSSTSVSPHGSPPCGPQTDTASSLSLQRRVGIVAGVALTVAAGTVAAASDAPEYEGHFELTVQPTVSSNQSEVLRLGAKLPQEIALPETVAPQSLDSAAQVQLLKNPQFINPVLKRLQASDRDLDYEALMQKLEIIPSAENQFHIRYRDTAPQQVQQVLEQLAQSYENYRVNCTSGTCQEMESLNAQIPQLRQQIRTLRDRIRQLHQQHGLSNIVAGGQQFSSRVAEVAEQKAALQTRLLQTQQQYALLQHQLQLQPSNQLAVAILNHNVRYGTLLQQLKALDQQAGAALHQTSVSEPQIQSLHAQHQALLDQLQQEAAQSLPLYLARRSQTSQDREPVYLDAALVQESAYLATLQRLIGSAHQLQVLSVRQQTLLQIEQQLNQQKPQWVALLRQYDALQQELQASMVMLSQSQDRLAILQAQTPQPVAALQAVSAPKLVENLRDQPAPIHSNLPRDLATGGILGISLGAGTAAILERLNAKQPASSHI